MNADFMPYDSIWDSYKDSTFYAHWKNGEVSSIYVDPEELLDVINYKKSLASLLQVNKFEIKSKQINKIGGYPKILFLFNFCLSVFRG